jgi:hypothetical protein
MSDSSDTVLERTKVREVAGVFHSRAALDAAVDALLLAGFDRADIDVIDSPDAVRERLGAVRVAAEELADVGSVPRRPVVVRDDMMVAKIVAVATLAAIGAMFAALGVVATDGGWAQAVAAAAITGGAIGGIGALLVTRVLARDRVKGLEPLMTAHGLVVWVRVHSPEQEDKAQDILLSRGGEAVRVHEIEIEKRADDLPLASLRPDSWLGSEPLGRP